MRGIEKRRQPPRLEYRQAVAGSAPSSRRRRRARAQHRQKGEGKLPCVVCGYHHCCPVVSPCREGRASPRMIVAQARHPGSRPEIDRRRAPESPTLPHRWWCPQPSYPPPHLQVLSSSANFVPTNAGMTILAGPSGPLPGAIKISTPHPKCRRPLGGIAIRTEEVRLSAITTSIGYPTVRPDRRQVFDEDPCGRWSILARWARHSVGARRNRRPAVSCSSARCSRRRPAPSPLRRCASGRDDEVCMKTSEHGGRRRAEARKAHPPHRVGRPFPAAAASVARRRQNRPALPPGGPFNFRVP